MNSDASSPPPMSPEAARAALDSAAATREAVHAKAGWMTSYMVSFGIGFGAAAVLLGMVEIFWLRMGLFLALWTVFVVAMIRWAATRPASLRTDMRRTAPWWAATGILYAIALFLGTARFQGEWAFWLPAAVLIALPLVLGGLRERRA